MWSHDLTSSPMILNVTQSNFICDINWYFFKLNCILIEDHVILKPGHVTHGIKSVVVAVVDYVLSSAIVYRRVYRHTGAILWIVSVPVHVRRMSNGNVTT